ncbi:MAG TPA: ribonuclease Y [Candidatus Saccharimonadales bacterium]|nr:ribonuclease Y [Candidatus Saccharimonadales bacterium]
MLPLFVVAALAAGGATGYATNIAINKNKSNTADSKAKKILDEAQAKAKETTLEAKTDAIKIAEAAKREESERRKQLIETENRLSSRETTLDKKLEELDRRAEGLRQRETDIEELKDEIRTIRTKQQENLEKIAKLKREEARDKLMQMTERDIKADLVGLVDKLRGEAQAEADDNARVIVTTAMERIAGDLTSERTVTAVELPSEEMKGRVIGKEGRNIQAFERATGVDVIIDETPGAIILSSFDPLRRQVARIALEKLLQDGRIHPARIEEVVQKAEAEVDKIVKEAGEKALKETGVVGVPPELVQLLGQLKFRTSFSQNVLQHSIEMSQLAGIIATEVGADVRITKTAALLHDIGKALTHEIEGKHHHISGTMIRKYGMDEVIAHAAEAHHDDIDATTPEAMIVRVVDAISAGRPGARGDTLENYAKRMTELENLANTFPGINKSYAVSAGREIRIIVTPEEIDDLQAIKLARDIATKIEATLKYPGTIKVNVIRETRATEFAK